MWATGLLLLSTIIQTRLSKRLPVRFRASIMKVVSLSQIVEKAVEVVKTVFDW